MGMNIKTTFQTNKKQDPLIHLSCRLSAIFLVTQIYRLIKQRLIRSAIQLALWASALFGILLFLRALRSGR